MTWRARVERWRGLLLALSGAAIMALVAPPLDVYPAVLPGLALLAGSVDRARTAWRAFGRAALWATAGGLIGLRFVPSVIQRFTPLGALAGVAALVLLAAAQSLVWAIGAAITSMLRRKAQAPLEVAFPAGILVATSLPTIFAWTPAGLVSPWPAFVQLADAVGERGVSALLAFIAVLV